MWYPTFSKTENFKAILGNTITYVRQQTMNYTKKKTKRTIAYKIYDTMLPSLLYITLSVIKNDQLYTSDFKTLFPSSHCIRVPITWSTLRLSKMNLYIPCYLFEAVYTNHDKSKSIFHLREMFVTILKNA